MPMLKTVKQMKLSQKNAAFYKKGWGVKDIFDYLVGAKLEQKNNVHSIKSYLHSGHHAKYERVCAERLSPNLTQVSDSKYDWAQEMLDTKRAWGKETGRQYYHFVFSPDPQDKVGVDEVADMAAEWAGDMYPEGQWAVEVHDDNTHHIPHAHIILNSVLPKTGYKIQRSNRKIIAEARAAQSIAEKHGCSTLTDIVTYRKQQKEGLTQEHNAQPDRLSMSEIKLTSQGKWSWKQDIRTAINESIRKSKSYSDFIFYMEDKGYKVNDVGRVRDITFYHPLSTGFTYRASSKSLGADYTKAAIEQRLSVDFTSVMKSVKDEYAIEHKRVEFARGWVKFEREIALHKRKYASLKITNIYKPKTFSDSCVRVVSQKAAWKNIHAMAETINLLSRERIDSLGNLKIELGTKERKLPELEVGLEESTRAQDKAQTIYDMTQELKSLESTIESLREKPILDVKSRLKRNAAQAKMTDVKACLNRELKAADDFFKDNAAQYATDEEKATLLLTRCKEKVSAYKQTLDETKDKVAKYQALLDMLGKTIPQCTNERKSYESEAMIKRAAKLEGTWNEQASFEGASNRDDTAEKAYRVAQAQKKHALALELRKYQQRQAQSLDKALADARKAAQAQKVTIARDKRRL